MRIARLRFSIFCLIAFCLICIPNLSPVFKDFDKAENITYYFYVKQNNLKMTDANITTCGNASIVECDAKNVNKIKNNLDCISGESVRLKNYTLNTLNTVLATYQRNIIDTETLQDYKIYYCYDASLPKSILLDGKKINIQIAINQHEINIGYPLILNGF